MASWDIPPMITLCCLLFENLNFEQEETEDCGRGGSFALAFRYFHSTPPDKID